MNNIKWGIIGCGDVTEVKSGPAFNLVPGSSLVAVMRRDKEKAADYARRHAVPRWFTDAQQLIDDPEVNAIYVATPPSSHEAYTMAAIAAGKPVYVEKPMALNEAACRRMSEAADKNAVKLSVAHYRRALPLYVKIKELIDGGTIGDIRFARVQILQPPKAAVAGVSNWRVDPAVSGGGLFHDLSPHQLDLMLYYFGDVAQVRGYAANQARLNPADDLVTGEIIFKNGVAFQGIWCFSVAPGAFKDSCEIIGSSGKMAFSFFGNQLEIYKNGNDETQQIPHPKHVQQPMIEAVVHYFLGKGPNPCSGASAIEVMKIMDAFTHQG